MPIYEFQCNNCRRKLSVFVKSITSSIETVCPYCNSKDLVRLVSSFGISKTIKSVHEQTGEDERSPDYYKDPRNIGRWTERKFKEMGMEMPSQIREMIDAAREGEMPGPVKELQPGLKEV